MAESEDSDKVVDYYAILNVRKEVKFARSLELKEKKLEL